MTRIGISDLDNCLADDSRRIPLIRTDLPDGEEKYAAYHADCGNDPACPYLSALVQNVDALKIDLLLFVTARPESVLKKTNDWIARELSAAVQGKYWDVVCRPNGDNSGSAALKVRLVNNYKRKIRGKYEIVLAWDDRRDVLAAYVEARIVGPGKVSLVKIHELDSTEGKKAIAGPAEILSKAAETFMERNKVYGSGYKRYGVLLKALFPEEGLPSIQNERDMLRLNLVMMCAAKLQRYASNFKIGGHQDSVRDLQVYAAMLEENTK